MKRLREEKIAGKRIREIEKKLFVCDLEEIFRLEVQLKELCSKAPSNRISIWNQANEIFNTDGRMKILLKKHNIFSVQATTKKLVPIQLKGRKVPEMLKIEVIAQQLEALYDSNPTHGACDVNVLNELIDSKVETAGVSSLTSQGAWVGVEVSVHESSNSTGEVY